MKKNALVLFTIIMLLLHGCTQKEVVTDIAATTLPVYEFTARICEGTDLTVSQLIVENVSCLHDYSLQVRQMRAIEGAEVTILSGAGLEEFMEDAFQSAGCIIDASEGIPFLCASHVHGDEVHHEHSEHEHSDPHIWLSPANARIMADNICRGLCSKYPIYAEIFRNNLSALIQDLNALENYGKSKLSNLGSREIITFHDGFAYLCEAYDLELLESVEEEAGSEPSASEIIRLTQIINNNRITAIFTEKNGSTAAAQIISAETKIPCYELDMALSGYSYFDAMYRNFDTLWEALK